MIEHSNYIKAAKRERIYAWFLRITKRMNERQVLAILAVFVGALAGVGTYLFEMVLYLIKSCLVNWFDVDTYHFLYFIYPAIGIVLVSLFVKYIVKVGQDVKTNDPLLTFDDTADEFSSQLLQSIAEEQDEDEIIATNAPILSKVTGKVVDIAIYHSCPTKDMTPSMKKLVEMYDSVQTKRAKTIGKYRSVSDANTIVRPGDTLAPDKSGKVKGVPLPDGVMIDFYVEYIDIMAPGDKTSASALKATQSFVIPTEYAPYTESWPERKIDMAIASIGMYKRMCLDVVKVGGLTKLLIEVKRQHKNKYLDRIRAQRKKSK